VVVSRVCGGGCKECEPTKSHAVKVVRLSMWEVNFPPYKPLLEVNVFPLTQCLRISHMHVLGVVYRMKRSEWGLVAWYLGSWWCVCALD
jgi:hypothetical protein